MEIAGVVRKTDEPMLSRGLRNCLESRHETGRECVPVRSRFTAREMAIRTIHGRMVSLAIALVIGSIPLCAEAQVEPGMGGNVGKLRTEAAVYRAHVRNVLASLLGNLGGLWDDSNPALPSAFYMPNAVIALGSEELIQGRPRIQAAFAGKLGKMRGVHLTMDEFDLSDELAFVRGTMSYELIQPGNEGNRETAAFAMILRVRRDEWLIQSLLLGRKPLLQEPPS